MRHYYASEKIPGVLWAIHQYHQFDTRHDRDDWVSSGQPWFRRERATRAELLLGAVLRAGYRQSSATLEYRTTPVLELNSRWGTAARTLVVHEGTDTGGGD